MSIATFHVASTARLASANHVASPPARIWEWLRLQRSKVALACVLSHNEEEPILQHHMAPSPNDVAVFYFPLAVGGGDGDFLWKEVDKCIDALIFKKVDVIGVWERAWHYNSMRGGKRIDFMPENTERKCRHVYKIGRRRNMVDFGKQIAVEVARRANAFLLDTATPIFEGFTECSHASLGWLRKTEAHHSQFSKSLHAVLSPLKTADASSLRMCSSV